MKALRRLGVVLWLALALVLGQQAAVVHDLGHASEKLAHKQDSKPANPKCDQHFACAQVGAGGAPPAAYVLHLDNGHAAPHERIARHRASREVLAYLSRGPPAAS